MTKLDPVAVERAPRIALDEMTDVQLVAYLGNVSGPPTDRALPAKVDALMLQTRSAKVRNAAALALLEWKHPGLETAINQLLARPELAKYAGTLLFCLLDGGLKLDAGTIPILVAHGSYEARSELLILTSAGTPSLSGATHIGDVRSDIVRLASSEDAETAEVASLVLEDLAAAYPVDA